MARIDLPLFPTDVKIVDALDATRRTSRRALVIERGSGDQRMIGFGKAIQLMQATKAASLGELWDDALEIGPLKPLATRDFQVRTVRGDLFANFGVGASAKLARVWYETGGPDELARLVGGVVRCYCQDSLEHSCDPEQLVDGKCPDCDGEVDCG